MLDTYRAVTLKLTQCQVSGYRIMTVAVAVQLEINGVKNYKNWVMYLSADIMVHGQFAVAKTMKVYLALLCC